MAPAAGWKPAIRQTGSLRYGGSVGMRPREVTRGFGLETRQPSGKLYASNFAEECAMPSYDYVCKACHKKFSVHLSISDHDKGKAKCPRCGSKRLEQRLTAFTAVTSKKS